MECGDLSPLFGEGFSLHNPALDPDENVWPAGWKPFLPCARWKRPTFTSAVQLRFLAAIVSHACPGGFCYVSLLTWTMPTGTVEMGSS